MFCFFLDWLRRKSYPCRVSKVTDFFFFFLFTVKRFQTYIQNFHGIGKNWITVDALNNLTKLASWTDEFISCDVSVCRFAYFRPHPKHMTGKGQSLNLRPTSLNAKYFCLRKSVGLLSLVKVSLYI